jgi:hypothetical protein
MSWDSRVPGGVLWVIVNKRYAGSVSTVGYRPEEWLSLDRGDDVLFGMFAWRVMKFKWVMGIRPWGDM